MIDKPKMSVGPEERPDARLHLHVTGDLPDGGSDGQVLTKQDGKAVWADPPAGDGGDSSAPGEPGKDGGYYVPTVNEDGDLSWTPSDKGMPDVAAVNIKGPPGDKGSDASVTAESVQKALGYTPADAQEVKQLSEEIAEKQPKGDYALKSEIPTVPEPYTLPTASETVKGGVKIGEGLQMNRDVLGVKPEEFEVLEDVTLTEEVSSFVRTGYNLTQICIDIVSPADAESTIGANLYLDSNKKSILYAFMAGVITAGSTRYTTMRTKKENDVFVSELFTPVGNGTEYVRGIQASIIHAEADEVIKKLSFFNKFVTGTRIVIKGVRANA